MLQKFAPFARCCVTTLIVSSVLATPAFAAEIHVVLQDGSISPKSFTVKQNEQVHIDVVNRGSKVHNFVIPDYYIFTSNLQPGESTTASFDAHKTGRFAFYSDKDNVPEPGMEGHMTVTG